MMSMHNIWFSAEIRNLFIILGLKCFFLSYDKYCIAIASNVHNAATGPGYQYRSDLKI